MKLKLKQKKRSRIKETTVQKSGAKEKVALHALQKQLQVLKLREAIILASFILGAGLLRVPMQAVPSAEPITFFALLAGWLFGKKKGFLVGAGALLTSNFFVFGGQGPWTIFQLVGFGAAGWIGGYLNEKSGYIKSISAAIVATFVFEIVINAFSFFIFPTGWLVFITAIPFMTMHLVSNVIFSLALPKARKFIHEKGQFNEKAMATELVSNLKSRIMPKQN